MNDDLPSSAQHDPSQIRKWRILIADDHSILRDGLRALLEGGDGLEVVGAVDDSAEVLRVLASMRPDLVLIDISMRNMDGLSAIREIKRRSADAKVLVLTANHGEQHIRAALQAGVEGYVLKDASRAELLMAIESVLSGKRFISPAVSAHIVSMYLENAPPAPRADSLLDTLTAREKQVLKLIAEGRRNREIAKYLFISVKTVEKHRSNLMHKMDLHNTAALTSLAMEQGLVGSGASAEASLSVDGAKSPMTDGLPTTRWRRHP
jgi:DNA-binding NarL/FixJ family response regulator